MLPGRGSLVHRRSVTEASPGGREIVERCRRLRAAAAGLQARPLGEILDVVDRVGRMWADPADPARRAARAALAENHGVPERAIERVLEAGFTGAGGGPRYTRDGLRSWIGAELGDARVLDDWVEIEGRARRAFGPRLLVVLCARGVPTTPVEDLVAALCVKAPVWLKPATGADDLAQRFASTIAAEDARLGEGIETAGWPENAAGEVFARAEVVVATGRESTLGSVRATLGSDARMVPHGPRLSVALVLREALAERDRTIGDLAADVALAGQTGCLSPVVVYVEAEPAHVEAMVGPLHGACGERWAGSARRESPAAERAAWGEWFALAGVERAAGTGLAFAGGPDDAWSVRAVARATPPDPPPAPRIVTLAPVEDAGVVAELCSSRRGRVATVGVAGPAERRKAIALALAEAGVERVAPLGTMQRPPLGWRRDGRPTLGDLVRWVDREEG